MKYLLFLPLFFFACQSETDNTNPTAAETTTVTGPTVAEKRACAQRLIDLDEKLSAARNQATENQPISQTIQQYLKDMENIDFAGCPEGLEKAMGMHLKTWENIIPVTDKYADERGTMDVLFKKLEKSEDSIAVKVFLERSYGTWMNINQMVTNSL